MISYLLKSSELSTLFRFVSADFFKVVPVSDLLMLSGKLRKNSSDSAHFEQYTLAFQQKLEGAGIPVRLEKGQSSEAPSAQSSLQLGQGVLALYFFQIYSESRWILDFRGSAFAAKPSGLIWSPQPFYWDATQGFCQGVRDLYSGFYDGDSVLFSQALEALDLAPARAAFEKHVGEGDQTSVRFELKAFQRTFAEVFDACRSARSRIPAEFAVLGVLLLTLYENLERSGDSYDVREAFRAGKSAALRLNAARGGSP